MVTTAQSAVLGLSRDLLQNVCPALLSIRRDVQRKPEVRTGTRVSGGMFMNGFNKPVAMTKLADHTVRSIARPNNGTLYQGPSGLRYYPVIIEFPAIDSKFGSLETSGYDHYVGIPLSTSKRDSSAR